MAGKAADKVRRLESPEHIWSVIRELGRDGRIFTTHDVRLKTNAAMSKVNAYLLRLCRAGYLAEYHGPKAYGYKPYTLAKDSLTAPRVRKDGTKVEQGQCNESMWRSMRMLKTFSAHDLVATSLECGSPVQLSTAQQYLRYLERAGYVVRVRGGEQYRLLPHRVTGPKPPQIQRIKRVWDPNIQRVVWPLGEDGADGDDDGAETEGRES